MFYRVVLLVVVFLQPAQDSATENLLRYVMEQDLEGVEATLEAGADPNAATEYQTSALEFAINLRDTAIVKLLLDHGADPNKGSVLSPLYSLLDDDDDELFTLLIESDKFDPNRKDNIGNTPIHMLLDTPDKLEVFLSRTQGVNGNVTNQVGWTVLQKAVIGGDVEVLKVLGRYSKLFDPNKYGPSSSPPLSTLLLGDSSPEALEAFLEGFPQADVNFEESGRPIICNAAFMTSPKKLTLFLEKAKNLKLDVDCGFGQGPVEAAEGKNVKILKDHLNK